MKHSGALKCTIKLGWNGVYRNWFVSVQMWQLTESKRLYWFQSGNLGLRNLAPELHLSKWQWQLEWQMGVACKGYIYLAQTSTKKHTSLSPLFGLLKPLKSNYTGTCLWLWSPSIVFHDIKKKACMLFSCAWYNKDRLDHESTH
jgi:hypothetical protein